jgi:hypothetical protein
MAQSRRWGFTSRKKKIEELFVCVSLFHTPAAAAQIERRLIAPPQK